MRLGEVAEIRTGLVLSRKKAEAEFEATAVYKLFSLNNISEDGTIVSDSFDEFVSNDELDSHYFTEEGDVLMRLSHPYTAVYIDKEHCGLLVPSYFAIIKANSSKVLPKYLAWYLNSANVKKQLGKSQSGSRIPSTNQKALKNISILQPHIAKQKALIELNQLHQKEKALYKRLLEEKELYFQGITQQLLGGTSNE